MKYQERTSRSFPVMERLGGFLQRHGYLSGVKIGWHCHLTSLTAMSAEVMLAAGAELFLSECNPDTSDREAVECMRQRGAQVFLGQDSCHRIMAFQPSLLSDTGGVLISAAIEKPCLSVYGSCEITTSGINRLGAQLPVALPVVNINDGSLKRLIENFHGVGDGLIEAVAHLTGMMLSGRRAAVIGYGPVGSGVAHYLKRSGAAVTVVESCPIRELLAHYDGFELGSLPAALKNSELLVTCTGTESLLSTRQWQMAADGLHVFNVGHWSNEIDRQALVDLSVSWQRLDPHLERFELPGIDGFAGRNIYLATGGSPVNVVLLTGSHEPTLIHLTTEVLCLNYLARLHAQGNTLPAGVHPIPLQVEQQASVLALQALGLGRNKDV